MSYSWTNDDADALVAFCAALGISDHTIPLHVWANESDNEPTAHNPDGDASGLFQLMPSTAKDLGYNVAADPTLAAFRTWTVAEQLQLAVKYYASERTYLGTIAGFYAVTFLPAMAHLATTPAALCGANGPYAWAYRDNPSFDTAKKGYICGADLAAAAQRAYGPRAQSIAALVARRVDTQPELPLTPPEAAAEATVGILDPDVTLAP